MNLSTLILRTFRVCYTIIISCLLCSGTSLAQEPTVPYPSSPLLTPSVLAPEVRKDLETLLAGTLSRADSGKIAQRLCPHAILRSSVRNDTLQNSITETKVTVATELLFQKTAEASASMIDSFSFVTEFSPTRVLMRHMRPRFQSDLAGYSAPLSNDSTRPVRIEGEMGADVFVLIPPVSECGVQALVICPRRYEKIARLIPAPYELKKMRLLVRAKADAIVAASSESPLKAMVSILGSQGASLPSEWFQSVSGTKTLSATKSVSHDISSQGPLPEFEAIAALPTSVSVESRVDIGTEAGVLHSTRKRITTEVSTIQISNRPDLLVGRSPLSVDGGQCYLLTQWSEEAV